MNIVGKTYSLAHEIGRYAVQSALRHNRETFDRALGLVRRMLRDFTDEQLYQDDYRPNQPEDYYASRYQFAVVGGYTHDSEMYGDNSVWGEKIRNDKDYLAAVGDLNPSQVWVTLLDMHH